MYNNSRITGILNLVSGGLGILQGLIFIVVAIFFFSAIWGYQVVDFGSMNIVGPIYIAIGIVEILFSIVCIIGGVFALKRKHWGWALAGAIAGVWAVFPTGIAAIIFVVMGKDEFKGSSETSAIE